MLKKPINFEVASNLKMKMLNSFFSLNQRESSEHLGKVNLGFAHAMRHEKGKNMEESLMLC